MLNLVAVMSVGMENTFIEMGFIWLGDFWNFFFHCNMVVGM